MAYEKDDNLDSGDDLDERAIKFVTNFKNDSLDFYQEKFRKFNYFDTLYIKGAAKRNTPFGRANLDLPLAFQQIEPFTAQMSETMVGEAPYISYQGRTADDEEPAEQITDFTQYQLEQGGFLNSQTQWFRNLGKYGTAIMKVVWETEVEEIEEPILDPLSGQPVLHPETQKTLLAKQEIVLHDGPRFINVPIFDFFVPPSATSSDVQKLDGCVHRTWRTIDQLLANPNYKNKEKLRAMQDGSYQKKEPDIASKDTAKLEQLNQNTSGQGRKKFKGRCEVLEFWGDYKFSKSEFAKKALIVIADVDGEWVCLRCEENPFKFKFKPFVAANDYPVEGEFYGYGELDHIKGLITESTALRNARLDVANQSLNNMWLVERQSGVNLRELYSAPNKIILTNDNNGVKRLEMSGITTSSVQELAKIDFDIQNTTEIINPRQDVNSIGSGFGQTATGVNFLNAKSNLRLLLKARLLEQTYFKPLGLMLLMYNKDLLDEEVFYRTTGEQQNPYSAISPDAFASEVDFKPTSNPQKLSIEERKGNIGYLMQTFAQFAKVVPVNLDAEFLMKEVAKLSGFPHPEKIVLPTQTTIMQTPDGQILDQKGRPVQIVPVDETGKPIQQNQPQEMMAA